MSGPLATVLYALRRVGSVPKGSGGTFSCRCPAHDDRSPSLSVAEGDDGRVLIHCFAGCTAEQVTAALGLTLADLMPPYEKGTKPRHTTRTPHSDTGYATAQEAVAALERRHGRRSDHWTYTDTHGEPVCVVLRWDLPDGSKRILPVSLHGTVWKQKGMPKPRPLYRLPHLAEPSLVWVNEGEKAAECAASLGLNSTTSAHGANSAAGTDWRPLAARGVVILRDNDSDGADYADEVSSILHGLDPLTRVKVLLLPGLPAKGDIVDYVETRKAAGLTLEQIRDEIEALADQAPLVSAESAAADITPADTWSPPMPLVDTRNAIPFPIREAFPESLNDIAAYAAGVAHEIQVPVDLPCMLIPPIVSTAISQKFLIEIRGQWRETPPLWTMTILDSGERKSATFRRMTEPVHEWEKDEAERLRPEIAADLERREILEKERSALRRAAGEGDSEARDRAIELAQRIAELKDRELASLMITDGTSEAIIELMVSNGERALVATPEADAFDVMMGRYSEGQPNLGIWLCGYSGDRVRVIRRGKKASHLDRPHLCVAATVQPEAVRGLLESRVARGRGLLARYCWSVPRGMVGRRQIGAFGVEERLEMAYVTAIRRLLDVQLDRSMPPRIVRLSPEALDLFTEFERDVERELRQGGGLSDQRSWGAKLCGTVARLALGMHCMETVGRGSAHAAGSALELSAETMRAALAWPPYLVAHERIATGLIGSDPTVAAAERVLGWLDRIGKTGFSLRDCFTAVRGQFMPRAHDLDEPIRLLCELGYLRPLPPPAREGKPGQPPSPTYAVNPLWDRSAPR